jgi:DNA-binding phage protein
MPPIADQIREALAPAIRSTGMSEVSDRTGIHRSTIYQWLGGARDLPLHRIDAIAEAVGLSLRVRAIRSARAKH